MTYPEQVPEAEPGGKSPDLWDPQVVLYFSSGGTGEAPNAGGEGSKWAPEEETRKD